MNKQLPIVVALATLCAVPAFLVAERTQVRLRAFASEQQMPLTRLLAGAGIQPETAADVLAPRVAPARAVVAAPRAQRVVTVEAPRAASCADWRALRAGPSASAVAVSAVRACDGVMEASAASTAGRPTSEQRDVASHPGARPMEFLVDLSAP